MAVTLGYDGTLSNVTITASVLGSDCDWALVERSSDGGITYDQVRGAGEWPVSAASFTLTLDDYEFSPNEVNTYRVSPYDETNFPVDTALDGMVTQGGSDGGASTPDAASLDITGDLDLRVEITARDWTPSLVDHLVTKWTTTGNQRSYALILNTDGTLGLLWSTNGTAVTTKTSTEAPSIPASGRLALRATLDVDNGAVGNDVKFYTASSIDGTWTQLGSTVTTAGTTSIFASTAVGYIGASDAGVTSRFGGVVHAAQILSGINGTVVANPDFTAQANAAASFADTATPAKTWTINSTAVIVVPQSNTTTPTITEVWLKSPLHPFLNRTARVVGFSEVSRPARNGIFEVVGRTYPVAVTDLRSSRRFTVTIRTDTRAEAEEMDLILAAGDIMLLHIPPDTAHLWLPVKVYVSIADVTQTRLGIKDGVLCDFAMPCVEVAPPDLDTYGSTATWASIVATQGDWDDVEAAFSDWADVMDLIGDPEDLIVP
jgi:hypothetical protein